MRAIRIHRYGGPEVLVDESDAPEPTLTPHAVLIESVATSVNPIDWEIRSGARQKDFPLDLPAILGKDVSGIVRAVGSAVRTFRPGDRVIALAEATYAERVTVAADILTHLPDGVDPVDAAALPLVSMTGEQLVRVATGARGGQTIVVTGALGSVGRAAVHTARKLGARVIAGVRARQQAEAAELDVDGVLALDDEDSIGRLGPIDGVADTVGGDTAARLFERVRAGGRFGFASVLPDDAAARFPMVEVTRVFARPDASKLREFADDVRDRRFLLPVSARLPLGEARAAHERLEKGGGGKVVLTI
ncbi:NADP-dependent oxidoreductase [Sphingomonas sp. BK580]|uniref:NADP-dependent oxidoreductase n=1 Tax=Sphingomonas sp. BK580 TaxID=2586972 RepID=UPI001608A494|nr:NADP-dependent oxidoreductase [Sphingomonas sp. BK580]MBB3692173.1 NADPH:quinone reductase-like Zn-dependent oxidoreductase [Sphingomonas sp. BK580]